MLIHEENLVRVVEVVQNSDGGEETDDAPAAIVSARRDRNWWR